MALLYMGGAIQPKHLPAKSVIQRMKASAQEQSRLVSVQCRSRSEPSQTRALRLLRVRSRTQPQMAAISRYRRLSIAVFASRASHRGSTS